MEEPKIIKEGNYSPSGHNASSVVNINGISPIVMENHGTITAIIEPFVINPIKGLSGKGWHFEQQVYDTKGIATAVTTGFHPNIAEPKDNYLCIPEATKKGYAEAYEGDSVNIGFPSSKTRRGKVGHQMCNTLDTGCQQGVVTNYRIRKLTPRECFRLMGVDDADIDKIQAVGVSNSQQYKMAGNSIVVDNLYHIFRTMFVDKPTRQLKQLTLF